MARMLPFVASKSVVLWNSGSCPYAQRAWIALKEKGIDFECAMVDLQNKDATPAFGEAYYRANPNKLSSSMVPVLVVETERGDTNYYTESKVLLEVIEDLWPSPSLLGDDVEARYKTRLFSDAVYDSIWGGDRSPYQIVGRKLNDDDWDQAKEEETLCEMLGALDTSLQCLDKDGPFVLGSEFSFAECATAPFVQRADDMLRELCDMNILDLCQQHGYSRLGSWWKAVVDQPSVKETATPDPEAGIRGIVDMMSTRKRRL